MLFNAACLILLVVEYLTHNSQKCVYIVEWMEPHTGEEMGQLRDSNRWEKGWSHQSPVMHGNQRGLCLNKNVMLTWWRRWQGISHLAAAIKRTESMYNQGDLKPPVTYHCHCLQRCKSLALSNMQYHPSLLIRQETLGHPGVNRPLHITRFKDTELLMSVTLMSVDRSPAFGLNIWWSLKHMSHLFQIYFEGSRPSSDQKFWQLFWVTENWLG